MTSLFLRLRAGLETIRSGCASFLLCVEIYFAFFQAFLYRLVWEGSILCSNRASQESHRFYTTLYTLRVSLRCIYRVSQRHRSKTLGVVYLVKLSTFSHKTGGRKLFLNFIHQNFYKKCHFWYQSRKAALS